MNRSERVNFMLLETELDSNLTWNDDDECFEVIADCTISPEVAGKLYFAIEPNRIAISDFRYTAFREGDTFKFMSRDIGWL